MKRLKKAVARWALRQLEPEFHEVRRFKGRVWVLDSINATVEISGRDYMDLHYVAPIEFMVWPDLPLTGAG